MWTATVNMLLHILPTTQLTKPLWALTHLMFPVTWQNRGYHHLSAAENSMLQEL